MINEMNTMDLMKGFFVRDSFEKLIKILSLYLLFIWLGWFERFNLSVKRTSLF